MHFYMIYGKKVYTDLCFPQLVEIPMLKKEDADIEICAGSIPEEIKALEKEKNWEFGEKLSWLINLTCWFTVESGRKITYELKNGGREDYLKTYLLGYGLSMLHLQRGEMAIHCSALEKDGRAVLVAGNSGSGKSTTTTALLEAGFSLMADDMAIVGVRDNKAICYPAFPYQKLCRDVAEERNYDLEELIYIDEDKDKFLVPFEGEFDVAGKELCAIFFLCRQKESEDLITREVEGLDKFHICVNNLFLEELLGAEKYSPAVGSKCLEIASRVKVYLIGRPVEGDTVHERTEYIVEKWSRTLPIC